MQAIYLSPHFDDIAYSLSCLLKKKSLIIDVFSVSNYIENKFIKVHNDVSEIREKEEKIFCRENKLQYIKLSYEDRGIFSYPLCYKNVVKYNDILERDLLQILNNYSNNNYKLQLFCPLGVGKHYNHLEIFDIIKKNYTNLEKHFKIIFYAESPYLSYKNNYVNRIKFLHKWLSDTGLKEFKIELSKKQIDFKVRNLLSYKSQFSKNTEKIVLNSLYQDKKKLYEVIYK